MNRTGLVPPVPGPAPTLGLALRALETGCQQRDRRDADGQTRRLGPPARLDQSIEPAGTTHSHGWPVTLAIWSKSWS
jgi:hypothetical protein